MIFSDNQLSEIPFDLILSKIYYYVKFK